MTEKRSESRLRRPLQMQRRDILGAMAGGCLLPPLAGCADHDVAAEAMAEGDEESVSVVIDGSASGPMVDAGYAGFSYEKSSLATGFFTSSNQPLVRLFRRLGRGLLRIGGNSVDRTSWRCSSDGGTAHSVAPADIDALATFLRAAGWRVLYGINLATGSPAQAADEARFVAQALGPHLYAFEIGNEPDAYAVNGLRPPSFSYRDFISEWEGSALAITRAVPEARLTGPASAWHETSWTVPFARDEGGRIVMLTQHYYRANGLSPRSTLDLLLAGDPALPALLDPLREASRAAGIRDGYRLTEANSFYDGGAPHISNTFGAALWAIDFLFETARLGSRGVNFHGGGAAPGYTPIADDGPAVIEVRPEYYAMLLFSSMGAGRLVDLSLSTRRFALSAYAIAGRGRLAIMLVNKEPRTRFMIDLRLPRRVDSAQLTTLSAPALGSTWGITLDGASIGADGRWNARPARPLQVAGQSLGVGLGPASAVVVTT